jgi:hypothetical protein
VNIAGWVIGKFWWTMGVRQIFCSSKHSRKWTWVNICTPARVPIAGFGGKPIKPVGKVSLPVSFGDLHNTRT